MRVSGRVTPCSFHSLSGNPLPSPRPFRGRGIWAGMTPRPLLPGSRLSKVYSQSTLSLSTVANEAPNNLGVKRPTSR